MKKTYVFSIMLLLITFSLSLRAQDPTPYITIGDINVNESTDTIVGDCIQGLVSFDAETYTLTLNDATITSNVFVRIGQDFKIKLLGDNYISSMSLSPGYSTFIGPGTLTLGGSSVGIAIECPRTYCLTLTGGATLEITASEYGISAMYDNMTDPDPHYPSLVVDSSSLIITAPGCIFLMENIWLSECYMVAPADFQYQLDTWIPLSGVIHDHLEIRAGTVGIPQHELASCHVWGDDSGIHIEDLESPQSVEVVNLLGQTVYEAKVSHSPAFIPMRSGVYVVRVGKQTVKTVVK